MTNPRRSLFLGLLGLLLIAFIGMHAFVYFKGRAIQLPEYNPVDQLHVLDQNWNPDERQWFYHETQGGALELTIDYKWLLALEQPRIPFSIFGEVPKFIDPSYISRYGFLPNPDTTFNPQNIDWSAAVFPGHQPAAENPINNPARLPVGFARNTEFRWPIPSEKPRDVIGFTCALCHVGQLEYTIDNVRHGIRIDGGPAMTNVNKFSLGIGLALGLTKLPFRFGRFADEVLGPDHTDQEKKQLWDELSALIEEGEKILPEADSVYTTEEGFARMDALGRIGNFVYAEEEGNRSNWSLSNAPVNYPSIWDAPWYNWVQYNGSIMRPMVRNAGEAMGVFARVNFDSLQTYRDEPPSEYLFRSNVRVDNLRQIEMLIRGDAPFTGLRSPKWPEDIFGELNPDLVQQGRELYENICQDCHHAAPVEGTAFYNPASTTDSVTWTPPDSLGNRYLNLKMVNLYEIGTDPLQAENFARRIVNLGALGETYRDSLSTGSGGMLTAGEALPFLVRMTIQKAYEDIGLPDSLWDEWNGYRPDSIRAPLAYKARPLNGIWATAPYLHNGAVPTLYQMLSPHDERDEEFWLGSREFDPDEVGYVRDRISGGFKLDTRLPGNSNWGHLFQSSFDTTTVIWEQLPSGIIGPEFTPDERNALVEFLKSI